MVIYGVISVANALMCTLLERAHRDDRDFMEFIAEREYESQKEMLRLFQIPFPGEGQESIQSPTLQ